MSDSDPADSTNEQRAAEARAKRIETLRPYRWQKGGPSPNPGGRPSRRRFQEALEAFYEEDPERFADVIQAAHDAAKGERMGANDARKFLRDTIDGPLETRIAGHDGQALVARVEIELVDGPAGQRAPPPAASDESTPAPTEPAP